MIATDPRVYSKSCVIRWSPKPETIALVSTLDQEALIECARAFLRESRQPSAGAAVRRSRGERSAQELAA